MLLSNSNGMIETLYYFIWYKDESIDDKKFWIRLPDTIIFKNQIPQTWYFTSKSGEILIKKDDNHNNKRILEVLSSDSVDGQVIAYFLYPEKYNYAANSFRQQSYKNKRDQKKSAKNLEFPEEKICIYYMTKQMLEQFISDPGKPPEGILQKFIYPYGENETVIQAIYSSSICLLSKQQNYRSLYDKKYDPYERCTTFDGSVIYSRSVPLKGPEISNKIRSQAKLICEKITNISFDKLCISRIVFYFKPDKVLFISLLFQDNNLWFLYSSSLRTNDEQIQPFNRNNQHNNSPLSLGNNFQTPFMIKFNKTTNILHPAKLIKDITCINCTQLCQQGGIQTHTFIIQDLLETSYSMIIQTYENMSNIDFIPNKTQILKISRKQNPPLCLSQHQYGDICKSNVKPQQNYEFMRCVNSHIPPLLVKLYPNISTQVYEKLRENELFLAKVIFLCQDCFLKNNLKNYSINGSQPKVPVLGLCSTLTKGFKSFRVINESSVKQRMKVMDDELRIEKQRIDHDQLFKNTSQQRTIKAQNFISIQDNQIFYKTNTQLSTGSQTDRQSTHGYTLFHHIHKISPNTNTNRTPTSFLNNLTKSKRNCKIMNITDDQQDDRINHFGMPDFINRLKTQNFQQKITSPYFNKYS